MNNLELKIHNQQLKLSASLLILKEKEVIEKNKCNCRSYCRIFHFKHNWYKSKCSEILLKFQICLNMTNQQVEAKLSCDFFVKRITIILIV